MFAAIADLKTSEWQDPSRTDMRRWLQNRTPHLPQDTPQFSIHLQDRLAAKLETFVDAFISNLPDVLRKLRVEEDEQRQMHQVQQQDLDLERFLLIVAYAYEGRPEAADVFWSDPESNHAGFLHWLSRRASTPLVTAFCEMLQCLSEDAESAKSAHEFLLDEAHHASGKMRRSSSLTWAQIFKELEFFANKLRDNPVTTQGNAAKIGKFTNENAETEPESTMMLECYLRVMAKLATQSYDARAYLLAPELGLLELLCQLISSLVTPRLRACAFKALAALTSQKSLTVGHVMWRYLEACLTGHYMPPSSSNRALASSPNPPAAASYMESLFHIMSPNFDEVSAFIQFLTALTSPPESGSGLRDELPYPEDLGISTRVRPGIEPYIDYALGYVFALRASEIQDVNQQRILRFYCLDFAISCISSFNEDLLVLSNETNINVDAAISTRDLATYVTLHPFARVMEWMYDSRLVKGVVDTIHQNPSDTGKASHDSPLILGISRAVELVSAVLDLQSTYLDLVRPILRSQAKAQNRSSYTPTTNSAFISVEDGLLTSSTLISDLCGFCTLGNPGLALVSLKLLEKIARSPRIISAWDSGDQSQTRRNKAIVALEEFGEAQTIAGSLAAEFKKPLDDAKKDSSDEYLTKSYILDFIYSCLLANPDRPTIAHFLLGFQCEANTVTPGTAFDEGSSLFHMLLLAMISIPSADEEGLMQPWLINLKCKAMQVFKILWCSKLSSGIVLDELRNQNFLFHLLQQGLVVQQQNIIWDSEVGIGPDFLRTPAAQGYIDHLSMRAMAMEYMAHELCSVSQGGLPAMKRRIFDALGGQIKVDGENIIPVPSVFEFHDSLPQETEFEAPPPEINAFRDLDLGPCLEPGDASTPLYNIQKVHDVLLLKRNERRASGQVVSQQEPDLYEVEQREILDHVVYLNRLAQVRSYSLHVLKAWTKLLLVMSDLNDFKGASQVSFILQTLQAILPSLEIYGSEKPEAAFELAKLSKILLFKLDFSAMTSSDKQSRAIESLVSDKLFQLLHISLGAIAKWVGNPDLRAIYYSICYRYLTALMDLGEGASSGRRKTARTIQAFGDKLINVICDDAFCGNAGCQAAALILLGTLVNLGNEQNDNNVVESLNRLNFIAVLVDSLRDVLREWVEINRTGKA